MGKKEGLDSMVKLSLHRTFSKAVEFKLFLHGTCDAGARYCSSLDKELMDLMSNLADGEEGRGGGGRVHIVRCNARALFIFCGSVQSKK